MRATIVGGGFAVLLCLAAGLAAGCATVGPRPPTAEPLSPADRCDCPQRGAAAAVPDESPGWHEIFVGDTLVEYYVPAYSPPPDRPRHKRELLALIHGAGFCHFQGAVTNIAEWREWADRNNFILIAPAFERGYPPDNPLLDPSLLDSRGPSRQRYADSPCACVLLARCRQFEIYQESRRFPPGYQTPSAYLWSFIFPEGRGPEQRTDLKLNEIVALFQRHYQIGDPRFSLYGYSGGGQFVSRYLMLHPERLRRVALGGAGSFMFPMFEKGYPYGLAYAPEALTRTEADWNQRLAQVLDLPLFVFAGTLDFVGAGGHPASAWQGFGQAANARNFCKAMRQADERLKAAGGRSPDAPHRVSYVAFYGSDHGRARKETVAWLQRHWLASERPDSTAPSAAR